MKAFSIHREREKRNSFLAPKMVRFETTWIACISFVVKLILGITCSYLMWQRESYQIFDLSPISAVTIKVKPSSQCSSDSSVMIHLPNYKCTQSLFDVNDFILPPIENAAVSISTRIVDIEHVLRHCDNTTSRNDTSIHRCQHPSRCILPPFYRSDDEDTPIRDEPNLCWFKRRSTAHRYNYAALDYILFIKHFVEFTHLDVVRDNLRSEALTKDYINTCEYDPEEHPLCPKFRILKIFEMIEDDPGEYKRMLFYGSVIEIKINWNCNLDRGVKFCEPIYKFGRLDVKPYEKNPYDPGSNFLLSKHFFKPNDQQLHRVHTHIYNLRIIVSVTGEAGRFDLFQTTTSIGSFLGIMGTGSLVCDLLAAFITNFRRVKYEN